jgi:pimeloyl-ACP methyl ester carboxylesterase
MNLEQMVADTLSVTDYLRGRFHAEKIYLMGHSGGTFIGIHAAARAPEIFAAYIAIAQIANQLKSEVMANDFMLGKYGESGNWQMVRKLQETPVSMVGGVSADYYLVRDGAMHGLGVGSMHDMRSVLTGLLNPSLLFPEYSLSDKYRF